MRKSSTCFISGFGTALERNLATVLVDLST